MVKLATARESRVYGSRRSRERWEYTNAGVYVFSTIVFLCGFVAQLSREAKSGLVVLLIGLGLIVVVNIHDLVAHLAAINYRFRLMELDSQLLFVEVAVPALQALGALLFFMALLLLVLQVDRGFGYDKIEAHVLNLLIAGTSLWVVGSIHNSCQIYERADASLQILQHAVQIPFLMASFLFLAGAIVNFLEQLGHTHHGLNLLSYRWVWTGIIGSLLLIIGGLANVVKVVKMLQMEGEIKLEIFRGGAQDQLLQQQDDDFF
ncbi:hypothetical protein HanRHA438_Chr14g0682461 [Helianthus annuus]|uniref:Polypyrimidine tract-binding protein n=1 Tax=Helianthus annuus TaxID=4232 RepID=A0A251SNZ3_HELAN|nr:uncharacterized protein LOC110906319 [Helianthus annuus]KAF5771434.1 hypothetical protein HanXRQr2_Chr14g0670561 [Helianthus annuus]KAJ0466279.1 hypothetical protein HanHA300_Chr14g0547341 [Helianthus annuus]KAJ0471292.1 hypothetical protein HanIR_Chr14g0728091 [Helianthus annuus]KAJ0487840.1 hypothetical protein HanHA89_Chr14g0594811 [Helianthus annuus]KAJ0658312.1 hypothetical protein HanLR1_Chr14g0556331 [Helianthus annuus]